MTTRKLADATVAVSMSWALVACGAGGGDPGGGSATVGQAQGLFEGTFVSGSLPDAVVSVLVTPSGEIWALYGVQPAGELVVHGLVQGQAAAGAGRLTAAVYDYAFDGGAAPATITGTYQAGATLTGSVAGTGGLARFDALAVSPAVFLYGTPARLADVVGTWSGPLLVGWAPTSVSVGASGLLLGVSADGCRFSGSLVPSASGKNFLTVNLSFGAAPCAFPGQAASGVAIRRSPQQLVVAVVTPDRRAGTVFFGRR